ncbi:MAG: right-handed parallel beta-helix repeat-containing protein [Thermoanaerobaculales bacterium]|jgi:predicted outer membrane repeat protein|nr:right-handed parallel beta-helix repeat-containing protein [Thermoanaerobaculales bacterium]
MSFSNLRARFFHPRNPVLVVLVAAVGWACPADAAVIRVATTGSDVSGCGSVAIPCRSLQYAINLAANNDEIRVAEGTYTGVSTIGDYTQLAAIREKYLELRGGYTTSNWTTPDPVANLTTLDAQGMGVVLYLKYSEIGACRTTIDGFEITGGNAAEAIAGTDEGGGICADRTAHMSVAIERCHIHDNVAESGAGGVLAYRCPRVEVVNSVVEDNTGHGIKSSYTDHVSVVDSTITDNTGAGILVSTAYDSTEITGNTVSGNSPGIKGISVIGGTISDNTVENNTTDGTGGGGITISGATDLLISGNVLTNNVGNNGGGLRISGMASTVIEGNIATSNQAPYLGYSGGGGFYINAGATGADVEVIGNTLVGNSTANQGGGMLLLGFVEATGNVVKNNTAFSGGGVMATITGTLEGNRFIGNSAKSGGGLGLINPMGVNLVRNDFLDNHATDGEGGGAYLWGTMFFDVPLLDGNRFINNTSTDSGGGLYIYSQDDIAMIVTNLLVQGNVAGNHRSGMYQFGVTMEMSHSTFAANIDGNGDGIGFYTSAFGDEGDVTMTNCIVAGQKTGIQVASGDVTIDRMLWGDGAWANDTDWSGGGVLTSNEIWGDPQFGSAGGEGFHLDGNSPARDAGVDVGVLVDMDGDVRPNPDTMIPDIGADEWTDRYDVFSDGFEDGGTAAWSG